MNKKIKFYLYSSIIFQASFLKLFPIFIRLVRIFYTVFIRFLCFESYVYKKNAVLYMRCMCVGYVF